MNRSEMAEKLEMLIEWDTPKWLERLYNEAAAMLEAPAVDCGPGGWFGEVLIHLHRDAKWFGAYIGKDTDDSMEHYSQYFDTPEEAKAQLERLAAALDGQPVKWEE